MAKTRKATADFEDNEIYRSTERPAVKVLSVDNGSIIDTGLVRSGEQVCEIKILNGKFKVQTVTAVNMLNSSPEQDKIFSHGDKP